jgi:hypothetical protein
MKTCGTWRQLIELISVAIGVQKTYQNADDAHNQEASFDIKAVLAHKSADCFRYTNSSFADDDDGEQTHSLHQMRLLKAQHAPAARNGDDGTGFQGRNNVPHEVHKPVVLRVALERGGHGSESAHCDCVDKEHEAKRKVQFCVAGAPCEELVK